jgi:four helix bundle protein
VYIEAHQLAMEVFHTSHSFPKEEKYSLTDQIRRSTRSVAVNIAEGWGKRTYEGLFKKHLVDSTGSLEESKSWLLFALNCNYITEEKYLYLIKEYEKLCAKLYKLHENWKTF